ncbi:MAG: DUF6056 family protein [Lachnospiraceae bacterium]|nr:DUF6056 family protein [Lachnospiraceae bacterium]
MKTEKEKSGKFNPFFGIDDKYVAVILVAFFVLMMIPIIYLGKYNFMKADDFSYGDEAHVAFARTGSVIEAFKGALVSVKSGYQTWQGTFSSIFLMSFSPYIFNYRFYKLVPAIMITMITLSSFLLSYTVVNKVCNCTKKSVSVIMGAILSLLLIERLYTVPGALYWYNAAVHYIFAESIFFFMASFYILICLTDKKVLMIALSIVSVLCAVEVGGSNYSTVVTAPVTLITLTVILFVTKKKRALLLLPSLIVLIVCVIINVAAPGNSVRGGMYEGYPALQSILLSFKGVFDFTLKWIDVYTIAVLILLIPILKKCVENTSFSFRFPYFVFMYSVCIVATGFTSSYYSLGSEGLSRTQNVIKMMWQILLIVNEGYFIGWITKNFNFKKSGNKGKDSENKKRVPLILLVPVLLILTLQPAFLKDLGTIPTYTAYEYVRYGFAQAYWAESMERLAILENPEIRNAVLKEHTSKPFYLYISDINDNPEYWENQCMASYYQKDTVVLEYNED